VARLLTSGAEANHWQPDDLARVAGTDGSPVVVSSPVRSGAYAYQITMAAGYFDGVFTGAKDVTYMARAWVNIANYPSSELSTGHRLLAILTGATELDVVTLRSDGFLRLGTTGTLLTASALALNTWYCLELSVSVASGTNVVTSVARLNATQFATRTNGTSTNAPNRVRWGGVSGTPTTASVVYFDDLALNDTTGSAQTSWPGVEGRVIHLLPKADAAAGTDWKLGTGTTPSANAYDAVNNKPPVGVSNGAAGSDAKQIRDSVASVTEPASDADFTMQTYVEAGMGASDEISLLRAIAVLSDTSSSVAVSAGLAITANPSLAEDTVATLSTTLASTYPSGWDRVAGSIAYAPSVTQGSSPTLRLGKRSAVATVLLCCYAAIQVEYKTPATADLTGSAAIAVGITAAGLNGKASLTGTAAIAVAGSASLTKGGALQGSSAIHFTGAVVPPTATANLVGSAAIQVQALGSWSGLALLTGSAHLSLTATVVPPTPPAADPWRLRRPLGLRPARRGGQARPVGADPHRAVQPPL
jgi:hypothetical protein